MMKVTVIAKDIELTPALRESVEKKIGKLEKYFEGDVEAKATLKVQKTKQRNEHKIEVTIPFSGSMLRCEESTEDMYKSIDLVEDKLERQIRKQKTKLSRKKGGSVRFAVAADSADAVSEDEGNVVKVKKFGVKPMSSEEAILQMDLLGHNFFLYQDAETNKVNAVYKRKDGNYGILEPELV